MKEWAISIPALPKERIYADIATMRISMRAIWPVTDDGWSIIAVLISTFSIHSWKRHVTSWLNYRAFALSAIVSLSLPHTTWILMPCIPKGIALLLQRVARLSLWETGKGQCYSMVSLMAYATVSWSGLTMGNGCWQSAMPLAEKLWWSFIPKTPVSQRSLKSVNLAAPLASTSPQRMTC